MFPSGPFILDPESPIQLFRPPWHLGLKGVAGVAEHLVTESEFHCLSKWAQNPSDLPGGSWIVVSRVVSTLNKVIASYAWRFMGSYK